MYDWYFDGRNIKGIPKLVHYLSVDAVFQTRRFVGDAPRVDSSKIQFVVIFIKDISNLY